jgi:hypothetical protein
MRRRLRCPDLHLVPLAKLQLDPTPKLVLRHLLEPVPGPRHLHPPSLAHDKSQVAPRPVHRLWAVRPPQSVRYDHPQQLLNLISPLALPLPWKQGPHHLLYAYRPRHHLLNPLYRISDPDLDLVLPASHPVHHKLCPLHQYRTDQDRP